MEDMSFIAQLSDEINRMDLKNFIVVALLFYVPFHFSKKSESLFFHLLFSGFGIYMLLTMEDIRIIYDAKMLVGLGLLLPQLQFLYYFTQDTIQTIKMMTANTYYFFVTIYYKILRFFNWLKSTYIMLKTFFTTFSFKKEDYQEQSSQENYSYEQKHQKFYEEPKQEQQKNEYKHQEKSYTQQEEHQNKSQNKTHYETDEFAQFYSESAYVVLGVNADDDFKTIKKAYRNLVKKYHPDLNPNELEKYTEITQLINNAYEKIEK